MHIFKEKKSVEIYYKTWVWSQGTTLKDKTDPGKLSSDLHTRAVAHDTPAPTPPPAKCNNV